MKDLYEQAKRLKELHEQSKRLTEDAQGIEKMLFAHNDGIEAIDKISLENIQATVAQTGQALTGLYASIAQEIRRQNALRKDIKSKS